jgi:tubulin polyglutamylase TTLL11
MNQLLRKGPLVLSLNVMRKLFDNEYDFYPRTWFLPEQLSEFKSDCKYIHEKQSKSNKQLTTFIVKPNDGSQGDGIYLIRSPDEYLKFNSSTNLCSNALSSAKQRNSSKGHIVQEYIYNPFLIDGLKCDLRIYVVIVSLKPLEIFLCDEGLVRFATVNYQYPDDNNLSQTFMHLTNYSLNKKNQSYKFTESIEENNNDFENSDSSGQGSKRKLSRVFNYMSNKGYNVNKIKSSIDDLVIKTILALLPEMKVECAFESFSPGNKQKPECFQVSKK